jgi:hypothetical protein
VLNRQPDTPGPHWGTQGLLDQVLGGVVAGIIVAVASTIMTQDILLGLLFAALAGTGTSLLTSSLCQRCWWWRKRGWTESES